MKKLLIGLFSLCLIFSFSNVNACETCGCQDKTEISTADTETKKACEKSKCTKSKKQCCKSKKGNNGKYSSGSNSGFKFNKKSSCSKAVKKCGEGCAKACCAEEESTDEGDDSDDDNGSEE
tara:strand:- start:339 stop:701 length:363 start_codon:yes stop_codon:yes gene_type:complete